MIAGLVSFSSVTSVSVVDPGAGDSIFQRGRCLFVNELDGDCSRTSCVEYDPDRLWTPIGPNTPVQAPNRAFFFKLSHLSLPQHFVCLIVPYRLPHHMHIIMAAFIVASTYRYRLNGPELNGLFCNLSRTVRAHPRAIPL
jgi:hypothetical protein